MKLIKKDAIRFSNENGISHEELVEDLTSAQICSDGNYVIRFFGNITRRYYVSKKTYAKCVQILKERIKKQAEERKND